MDINVFSDPGEFMRAAGEKGVPVGTTFGWAVSQTMMNRDLTFPQACRLLEVAGILLWAGDVSMIAMSGYRFWMSKKASEEIETDRPEKDQDDDN